MPTPATTAALIGAGSNLLGGLFSASGIRDQNRKNLQIAREQMQFQERMSNTAYQRSAVDLEKAGLNRILALGKPASTPAGQTARMENTKAPMGAAIASTAMQVAQIGQIRAQTELAKAQALAIKPKVIIGEAAGSLWERFKNQFTQEGRDKSPDDWFSGKPVPLKIIPDSSPAKQKAMSLMGDMTPQAKEKAIALLVKTVGEMDLPKMSVEQKLQWAVENPERIKQYLDRKKGQ